MTLYHDHQTVVRDRDRLLNALIAVSNRLALHAPRGNGDVLDDAKKAINGRPVASCDHSYDDLGVCWKCGKPQLSQQSYDMLEHLKALMTTPSGEGNHGAK